MRAPQRAGGAAKGGHRLDFVRDLQCGKMGRPGDRGDRPVLGCVDAVSSKYLAEGGRGGFCLMVMGWGREG